ncbi:MAG: M28 family peptidase [Bacteroidota bacterium]
MTQRHWHYLPISLLTFLCCFSACDDAKKPDQVDNVVEQPLAKAAVFNSDSAYTFVEKQVKFGPRVPNTPAHVKCGDYLITQLKQYGAEVTVQSFVATAFDGTKLQSRNIIASINPAAPKRILLAAHWDTRPFADQDTSRKNEPIDGANDGGSGVGILLEIARTIQSDSLKPKVGIDIILFDSEDYGAPEGHQSEDNSKTSYCLGSQYWAANKHKPGYSAYYGILLDMVGAADARFAREGSSLESATSVVNNIWNLAGRLGYGNYFIPMETGGIVDDHIFVNQVAKIPTIDIIEYNLAGPNYFSKTWHTHRDNLSIIDRKTLKAVGQTVLQAVYQEE